jgi:hypothetical protein
LAKWVLGWHQPHPLREIKGGKEMDAADFRLDYFQIYDLEKPIDLSDRRVETRIIELQGQFDKAHEKATIESLDKFADRVSKNDEELYDKNAHFTWYSLQYRERPIPMLRRVLVANQFTKEQEQELRIYGVIGLLVPAGKRWEKDVKGKDVEERIRLFSKSTHLDHYKVYEVIEGQAVDHFSVTLEDQFSRREATVDRPVAFAVPVWKRHGEEEFAILNEDAHLTIYEVDKSKDVQPAIETSDQFLLVEEGNFFRPEGLRLGASHLLAVPSRKVRWKEG